MPTAPAFSGPHTHGTEPGPAGPAAAESGVTTSQQATGVHTGEPLSDSGQGHVASSEGQPEQATAPVETAPPGSRPLRRKAQMAAGEKAPTPAKKRKRAAAATARGSKRSASRPQHCSSGESGDEGLSDAEDESEGGLDYEDSQAW